MTHKTRRYKRKKRHNKRKGESKKHNNTKKKFKPLKCSPKNKDKVLDFTCYILYLFKFHIKLLIEV